MGKGVVVCEDPADALLVLDDMMLKRKFGDAASTVVVEERLKGREVSVLCLVDGRTLYILESAQDHKRLLDDDQGPNTGGMGAYSPTPFLDDKTLDLIQSDILIPIVEALRQDETPYRGLLYAGLMLTPGGPKVLEFNCRFGDPEAQAILVRLTSDPLAALLATAEGRLDEIELTWDPRPSVCVVIAARGYPDQYERGKRITGLEDAARLPDISVFHAGTRNTDGGCITSGGRVLGITALGSDLPPPVKKHTKPSKKFNSTAHSSAPTSLQGPIDAFQTPLDLETLFTLRTRLLFWPITPQHRQRRAGSIRLEPRRERKVESRGDGMDEEGAVRSNAVVQL